MDTDISDIYWRLIDLAFKIDDKTDFYWYFYVGANIAIIGWMVTKGKLIGWKARIIGFFGYGMFLFMSFSALNAAYTHYDIVVSDIRMLSAQATDSFGELATVSSAIDLPYSNKVIKLYGIHLSGSLLMLGIILLYGSPWKSRAEPGEGDNSE